MGTPAVGFAGPLADDAEDFFLGGITAIAIAVSRPPFFDPKDFFFVVALDCASSALLSLFFSFVSSEVQCFSVLVLGFSSLQLR
jgi:hypothetical protein